MSSPWEKNAANENGPTHPGLMPSLEELERRALGRRGWFRSRDHEQEGLASALYSGTRPEERLAPAPLRRPAGPQGTGARTAAPRSAAPTTGHAAGTTVAPAVAPRTAPRTAAGATPRARRPLTGGFRFAFLPVVVILILLGNALNGAFDADPGDPVSGGSTGTTVWAEGAWTDIGAHGWVTDSGEPAGGETAEVAEGFASDISAEAPGDTGYLAVGEGSYLTLYSPSGPRALRPEEHPSAPDPGLTWVVLPLDLFLDGEAPRDGSGLIPVAARFIPLPVEGAPSPGGDARPSAIYDRSSPAPAAFREGSPWLAPDAQNVGAGLAIGAESYAPGYALVQVPEHVTLAGVWAITAGVGDTRETAYLTVEPDPWTEN